PLSWEVPVEMFSDVQMTKIWINSCSPTVYLLQRRKTVETFSLVCGDAGTCFCSVLTPGNRDGPVGSETVFLSSELLQDLLAELHRSISVLCSALLPESPASGLSGTTLCLLLDLVEVLMASALQCGEKAGLRKQDLGWVQWPRLLVAVSGPSDPFVKRRTLLLLKRVLLLKPGEEWTTGGRRLTAKPGAELAPVAHAVLAAVDAGWLDSIRVGPHTFFGGGVPRGGGADEAMLRAASLLLLRGLGFKVFVSLTEMGGASKLSRYLQRLWAFLRRWTPPQVQVEHLCCYLTVLFGEQDDDLMEAARAFLSVFLSSRGGSDLQTACSLGCNPHCHFVLLLRSFSFDHSLLLDFLIGTETCFLEYLVHYLRYLRRDWEGLTAACRASGGVQQPVGGSTGSGCGVRAVSAGSGPSAGSTLSDGLRLVEYDSSDESTEEETEDGGSVWRSRSECWSQPRREAGQVDMDLLDRTVRCLSELREVLVRLHSRQLFPYNPSSLLKLLAQVEAARDGGQTPT
uniref:Lines homolog 1 n=1 Tax=Oryzias melastigma TaxID=30732 RepID=A0A3B3D939_ORYME